MISRLIRLPPVIGFAFLLAGLGAHRIVPLSLGLPSFQFGMGIGCAVLLLGLSIGWAALSELRNHHTTAEPGQRPTTLVTSGIFSFSRNPLYLTQLLILCALAAMADSLWLIVSAALLWLTLDRFVVRSEEKLLEELFSQEYLAYKGRVRRWV